MGEVLRHLQDPLPRRRRKGHSCPNRGEQQATNEVRFYCTSERANGQLMCFDPRIADTVAVRVELDK